MKMKLGMAGALGLCAATLTFGADSWTGYISDSHCGAKGAKEGHTDCSSKCVKEKGGSYVFVNDADHKVYNIADQDKAAAHAGHHVTVKGSTEGDSIKISSIEMAK